MLRRKHEVEAFGGAPDDAGALAGEGDGLTFDGAPAPARLNGQPVTLSGQGTRIVWSAPEGLDLVLPAQHGLQARYAIVSEGWPAWAAPLPPRPARVMPWEDSGGSVILGSFR